MKHFLSLIWAGLMATAISLGVKQQKWDVTAGLFAFGILWCLMRMCDLLEDRH